MNEQMVKELIQRYLNGELSKSDEQQLEMWYMKTARNGQQLSESEISESVAFLSKRLPLRRPRARRLWPRIAAAASFVLVMGTALYFYSENNNKQGTEVAYANDIAPGKNGATLTLANGKQILIKDALAGNIAEQSGVKISKTAEGEIIYELTNDNSGEIAFNTLSTTRGEQTQVRLPDGTLVFLNAESSLKYPTRFTGSEKRSVSLTGEGYFEVAKDKKHPFMVAVGGQSVEVLGTHFNINAYTSNAVSTTLLEGSVAVARGAKRKLISPGEQAVSSNEDIKVNEVEVEDIVAWKNGYFMFASENLESIMGKLSRWYNVQVDFRDEAFKKETFFASVKRDVNISEVLKKLQGAGKMEFKLQGNMVVISAKK
jgi:transmembrane sensor